MVVPVFWQDTGTLITRSNGNLDANNPAGAWCSARSNVFYITGKWYCEIEALGGNLGTSFGCGLMDDATAGGAGLDSNAQVVSSGSARTDSFNLAAGAFSANTADGFGTVVAGTRIGIAADCDHKESYFSVGGVWIGTSNPVTRANPRYNWYGSPSLHVFVQMLLLGSSGRIHGDAASQTYAAPTGYQAWNVGTAVAQARVVVMA